MAISGEIVGALIEAIAALNLRVDEAVSKQSIQDAVLQANERTEQKIDVIIDSQIKGAVETWLRDNFNQPKDGIDGKDGRDGIDGRTPTPEEISLAVELWFEINSDELKGQDGKNGRDGIDGRNGVDGKDGKDGKDGRNGADGGDGVGISLVEQRDDKSFHITLTDGQEFKIDLPKPLKGGGGLASIYNINAYLNSLAFNLNPAPHTGVGIMQWNPVDGTLDLGLLGGNVTLQIGQETVHRVVNKTGATILNGMAVYAKGSAGQRLEVGLAIASSDVTSATILGVATEDIPNNQSGFITAEGLVRGLDTGDWTDGQPLYLSPTVAGQLTTTKPTAPQHLVFMGFVVKGNTGGAGVIFIKPQNGYEIGELHDVLIESPVDGQTLVYDGTLNVWRNVTGGGGSGSGTVTSVNASGGTTGLTFTGGPITTSGTLTLGGTLGVENGGTGVASLTGVVIGNGTAAFTAKANPTGDFVGTTDTQTLSSKTIEAAALTNGYTEEVFAITDGTVSLDPNNGSIQTWTLGDNRTPAQVNWASGQSITLMIDDGSAYTVNWSTLGVVWKTNSGSAPTLSTSGFTAIVLWKIGATIYGARVGDA